MVTKKKHKVGDNVLTSVLRWTLGKTKEKQTKYVRVTLSGGISWTGWATPKGMAQTTKTLAIMGFKGAKISDLQYPNSLDTEIELSAEIGEVREYQGNAYYDAKWVNSVRQMGFDESAKEGLEEFDIDTRAYIKDAKDLGENNAPADQSNGWDNRDRPTTNSSFTADDIPF